MLCPLCLLCCCFTVEAFLFIPFVSYSFLWGRCFLFMEVVTTNSFFIQLTGQITLFVHFTRRFAFRDRELSGSYFTFRLAGNYQVGLGDAQEDHWWRLNDLSCCKLRNCLTVCRFTYLANSVIGLISLWVVHRHTIFKHLF